MVVIPSTLGFRDVDTFAVIVHEPSLDDFAPFRRELDVADKSPIA